MAPEDQPDDNYIVCTSCSIAGGADMPVCHDPPECPLTDSDRAYIDALRDRRKDAENGY